MLNKYSFILFVFIIPCLVIAQNSNQTLSNTKSSSVVGFVSGGAILRNAVNKPFPEQEIKTSINAGNKKINFIGSYSIRAGVQKSQIGSLILESNGEYKIYWIEDKDRIATGTYEFNSVSNSIYWTGGFMLSKKFSGILLKEGEGVLQIRLSQSTFAEKLH